VRALNFLAMAALAGAFGFRLLVLDPALRSLTPVRVPARVLVAAGADRAVPAVRQEPDVLDPRPDAEAGVLRIARVALAGLAAASLGSLLLQALASAGDASLAALPGSVLDVLGTRYGAVWIVRAALLAALAGLLSWPGAAWRRALPWGVGLILGSGVLLTASLASHGAAAAAEHVHTLDASPLALAGGHALHALLLGCGVVLWAVLSFPRARRALPTSMGASAAVAVVLAAGLPVALDWLHLLAMALWVGGLMQLALVLPRVLRPLEAGERHAFLGALVPRFSRLALPCVAALVATGVYAAWLHVAEPAALTGTMYGVTILCKVALLLPLLALGAANLYLGSERVRRLLRRAPGAAFAHGFSSRLLRTVRLELVLAGLILLATGVLTSIPPAAETARAAPVAAFSESRETDAGTLTLSVDPAEAGVNRVEVLLEEDGRPVTDATRVAVRFALESAGVGQSESLARPAGDGRYVLAGPQLGLPGEWDVEVVARRPGHPDARAEFTVPVSPPRVVEREGMPHERRIGAGG
jgi:copper transport protein